jgi:hypothetical protein
MVGNPDESKAKTPASASDLSASIRAVLFATEFDEHPYATHGGTLFVVNFKGMLFGLTARHVFGDFPAEALLVTQEKRAEKGSRFAAIRGLRYPSAPRGEAIGTDITDLCAVEFSPEVTPDFFHGTAFLLDRERAGTAQLGEELLVCGMLKDATVIDGHNISVSWCRLEFLDRGPSGDLVLRQAQAAYTAPPFNNLLGVSGSPVFSTTTGKLRGMVVRGGTDREGWTIRYMDVFDIIKFLDAVVARHETTDYVKHFELGDFARGGAR